MITFTCCLVALIVGYFVYGKMIEKMVGIDPEAVLSLIHI